jgi:hypothetical protein
VQGLELAALDSEFAPATFVRSIQGMNFPGVPSINFYQQSTPSLWDAPHAPSASGTSGYAVIVRAKQVREPGKQVFRTISFTSEVIPFREATGPDYKAPYQETVDGDPVLGERERSFGIGGHTYGCAWSEDGTCGVRQDFADGTRIKLTVRLSNSVGGWFEGRIENPVIDVRDFSATNNTITVEAEPATVQRFRYVVDDVANLTNAERIFVRQNGFAGSWERFVTWASASSSNTFAFLNYFKPRVSDTAIGKNTFWNFASTNTPGQGSPCLADTTRVLGIVTTNAMVYDGGVPKFNRGFLDYRVAGLHYEADGVTEVLGSYDLVMRSDVARCLYGFSSAPVSATVSITGEGDSTIATTVVSERNGWLKLAAYGFTFSQKTIKVQITQTQSRTLNKFTGRTTTLSATQRSQIRTLVNNSKAAKTITCTGNFVKPADRATALKRAQNACAHARSINKNFKFVATTAQTKSANQDRTVTVRSR